MNKKVIGFLLLFLAAIAIQAQEKDFGLRMGYQNSVMNINGNKAGSSGNSFYVNAYKETKIIPFLYFHSGLQYSRVESNIESHNYQIDYLGAPLALKAKLGPLYALGGYTFNVKLNENNNPYSSSTSWYDSNAFAGLGFKLLFMTIDARYHWGLTDINQGIHNNSFQIGLGLKF
ncbi:porin family protein [Labilibacter sediminis]|nr:porin family protein [Labilibacter sediminis]